VAACAIHLQEATAGARRAAAQRRPESAPRPQGHKPNSATAPRRYVADFVAQFSPQTGVRPVEFEELQAVFRDYYGEDEEARVPLWTLYEGLLAFLLAVRARAPSGPRPR